MFQFVAVLKLLIRVHTLKYEKNFHALHLQGVRWDSNQGKNQQAKKSRIRIFLDYVRTFLCLFLLLTSKILFDKVPTFWPPCFLVIFWHFLKILRPLFNVYGYDQQKVRLKYTINILQNISQKFNFFVRHYYLYFILVTIEFEKISI